MAKSVYKVSSTHFLHTFPLPLFFSPSLIAVSLMPLHASLGLCATVVVAAVDAADAGADDDEEDCVLASVIASTGAQFFFLFLQHC